jgi:2-amino-4-hydroxy-6-hydroxymethyldihydropteridine diphosphokinase
VNEVPKIPVYIGLGSNQGRPEENLAKARKHIQSITGVFSALSSQVYYTEPQGVKEQPWFANQVIRVLCHPAWTPKLLMRHLLNIEQMLGRKRTAHWGPRRIDCDLLLFGRQVMDTPELTLPHPGILHRAFVLVPLVELTPDLCLPDGTQVADCLHSLAYRRQGLRIWQDDTHGEETEADPDSVPRSAGSALSATSGGTYA